MAPLSGHGCPRWRPAVRPSKRFAAGKTLPQGQFTCPEDVNSSGAPQKTLSFVGTKLCDFIKAFDKNN